MELNVGVITIMLLSFTAKVKFIAKMNNFDDDLVMTTTNFNEDNKMPFKQLIE